MTVDNSACQLHDESNRTVEASMNPRSLTSSPFDSTMIATSTVILDWTVDEIS